MGRIDLGGLSLLGIVLVMLFVPCLVCGALWWFINPVTVWQMIGLFVVCIVVWILVFIGELTVLILIEG